MLSYSVCEWDSLHNAKQNKLALLCMGYSKLIGIYKLFLYTFLYGY